MRARPGRTFLPALLILGVAGGVLFVADADWLRVGSALLLLVGIALGVFAIATPEFLAADPDEDAGPDPGG
jgi:hypothetical protein